MNALRRAWRALRHFFRLEVTQAHLYEQRQRKISAERREDAMQQRATDSLRRLALAIERSSHDGRG